MRILLTAVLGAAVAVLFEALLRIWPIVLAAAAWVLIADYLRHGPPGAESTLARWRRSRRVR